MDPSKSARKRAWEQEATNNPANLQRCSCLQSCYLAPLQTCKQTCKQPCIS